MTLYETYNKPLFHAKRGGVCIQSLLKQRYGSDDDDPVEPTTRLVVISFAIVRQPRNDRKDNRMTDRRAGKQQKKTGNICDDTVWNI